MKWFVRDVTNAAIRERGLRFPFLCVTQRDFCFCRGNENNFLRGGRIQEQLTRDVLCITFLAKPTLSLSFYLIAPQQRLAATPCHIRNLPAGEMHNWYEQMTWYRSVITSNERIQQHNRTIISGFVLFTLWFRRSEMNPGLCWTCYPIIHSLLNKRECSACRQTPS